MSKTTAPASRASRFFVYFSAVPTQLRREIVKFWVDGLKNGNYKAINLFTISLNSDAVSSLQFQPNFHTFNSLGDLVWGPKSFNGWEVYFSATLTFSLASLFSDRIKGLYWIVFSSSFGSCTLLKHQCFQTMIWDKSPGNCRPQNCRLRCLTQSAIKGSSAN